MPSEDDKLSQPAATSDGSNLYDIHLSSPFDIHLSLSKYRRLPNLSGLTEKVPDYLQPNWDNLNQTLAQKLVPGFMGLNLPVDLAAELLECLERSGGHGLVVPIGYRQPKVTMEMAYPIAHEEIAHRQELRFPNYKFEPTKFFREGVMWWEFGSGSEELTQKTGIIPGVIRAFVDKLDGHIWTSAEQTHHWYGEEYYLESATSLEPIEVLKLAAAQLGLEWSTDHKRDNKPCLKGPALVVGAVKSPSQNYIEKKYGFRPTVEMWFRLNRYKQGYEAAGPLMMRVVALVLEHDPVDALLVFDDSKIVTVLKRTSGQLIIDQRWSSWIGPLLHLLTTDSWQSPGQQSGELAGSDSDVAGC